MKKALVLAKKSFIFTLYQLTGLLGGLFGVMVVGILIIMCLDVVIYITHALVDNSSTATQAIITDKYQEEKETTDYYLVYRYQYEQNDKQVERISEPKSVNQDFYDKVEIGSQIDIQYDKSSPRNSFIPTKNDETHKPSLDLVPLTLVLLGLSLTFSVIAGYINTHHRANPTPAHDPQSPPVTDPPPP